MQKIERYEDTLTDKDILKYTVRKPIWISLVSMLGTAAFIGFFFYGNFFDFKNFNTNTPDYFLYFFLLFFVFSIGRSLYDLTLNNTYQLNMNKLSLSRKKFILGFLINSTDIKWNAESIYKYELEYDSYKKVTCVWFTSYHAPSNEKRQLIKFFNMATFNEFRRTFEEKYPSYSIQEWHA